MKIVFALLRNLNLCIGTEVNSDFSASTSSFISSCLTIEHSRNLKNFDAFAVIPKGIGE